MARIVQSKSRLGLKYQFVQFFRFDKRSFIREHWDFFLPVGLGLTLFLEDRILKDSTLTAFLILFGLTFLFSLIPQLTSRMQHIAKPMQYALAGVCVSGVVVVAAPLVLAQAAPTAAQCGGGLFGPLAQFFSTALGAAGGGGGDVCTLFGLIQAALVVVFVIAIGVAVYQVGQGAEFRTAFTPVALALVVVVAAGIIIRLFMGTGTTAAPTTGG